jgi:hypothetical protein
MEEQRAKQRGIDHAEDGRVGADSQRKHEGGSEGEAG